MKQIVLFRIGSIRRKDKAALEAAGYLPIEVKDPADVTILFPNGENLKGDAITQAALKAIGNDTSPFGTRSAFAAMLVNSLTGGKAVGK